MSARGHPLAGTERELGAAGLVRAVMYQVSVSVSCLLLLLRAFSLQRIEDTNGERSAIRVFSLLKKVSWESGALWSAKTQPVSSQNQERCHGDICWERAGEEDGGPGLWGAELPASSWQQGL